MADLLLAEPARLAVVGAAGQAGAATLHAEELARLCPRLRAMDAQVVGGGAPRDSLPTVQRRADVARFGNQRAVEFHPTLMPPSFGEQTDVLGGTVTHLVLDLDPPEGSGFDEVVAVAQLARTALDAAGLASAVKTSGSKGLHVVVPVRDIALSDAAAATRALAARTAALDEKIATTAYLKADRGGRVFVDSTRAGGGSLACAFSPRIRPGTPVSYPVPWSDLNAVSPRDFTIRSVLPLPKDDPWRALLPSPQPVPADVIAEGHEIPIARVVAMHEGKRRKRATES
ncbi:MAG: hypothetical protein R2742_04370 [Micropruina glycogenica]